ncbi:MAG TPA: carbohydrate deacetylase [Anaerolineae bacterium]|nr:carbohydrate deacetylase [Anaerolineae bacterium]
MTKKLIVNGDDFGRCPGVNRGIIEAHERGILTSTTLMVNMPAADEAFALAREHPDLGVGIHLVFTAGQPILPPEQIPTLVDEEGRFLGQRTWLADLDRADSNELRAELRAQIERFRERRAPTHLDCHHFVHVYPPLFAILVELAAEYGLPMRVPFGDDLEAIARREAARYGLPPEALLEMAQQDMEMVKAKGVPHPDRFVGEFFGQGRIGVENLLEILARLEVANARRTTTRAIEGLESPASVREEGVTEIMTHPGYVDEMLLRSSGYAREREEEVATLTDPRVREAVEELGIELVDFRALG